MTSSNWSPVPAAGATARIPLPPPYEAAKREAEKVGKEYGKFRADIENDYFFFFESHIAGRSSVWDTMTNDQRLKHLSKIQSEFEKLPRLPVAKDLPMTAAIREGFQGGANATYEER